MGRGCGLPTGERERERATNLPPLCEECTVLLLLAALWSTHIHLSCALPSSTSCSREGSVREGSRERETTCTLWLGERLHLVNTGHRVLAVHL